MLNVAQTGVAHEVCHLLGLPHVGVARRAHDCMQVMGKPDWDNLIECYKGDTNYETRNIMGLGDAISPWNGSPWLCRLFGHVGVVAPYAWEIAVDRKVPPTVL
jgi:hypothetical protein